MAIDTSMYSMLRGIDVGDAMGEGMKLKQMRLEQQAQEKQKQDQAQIQSAYDRAAIVDNNGNTSIDHGVALSELAKINTPLARQEAQNIQQQQGMGLEQKFKQAGIISNALTGVKDQRSLDSTIGFLEKAGIDVSQYKGMPYDPQQIERLSGMFTSAKDKFAQELEARKVAVMEREAANKARELGGGASGGKAPQGYRFKPDGSLEPIPGGPAAEAASNRSEKSKQDAGLVVQDIGRSLNLIDSSPTAAGTKDLGLLSYVPGSPTQQLDSLLDSVKANIGFNKLQAMREASPTGGALGSVSDKETAMLQATAGKLSSNMPEDQLKDNLKRLYNQYNDIVHGPGKGPKRHQLSFDELGNPVKQNILAESTKVLDGVTYKKVDGGWEEVPMPASR